MAGAAVSLLVIGLAGWGVLEFYDMPRIERMIVLGFLGLGYCMYALGKGLDNLHKYVSDTRVEMRNLIRDSSGTNHDKLSVIDGRTREILRSRESRNVDFDNSDF
jgi:hypothetical protein